MIPAQAVEAAAKKLSELLADYPSDYSQEAKELLEAAAPHLLADMRPMTMVEIANRDHPERMEAARKKLQEGAREFRRIERKQVAAKALKDAAEAMERNEDPKDTLTIAWLRNRAHNLLNNEGGNE